MVEILVVIAILAVLIGLGAGGATRMLRKGAEAKSVSNLRQVASGFMAYTADNAGSFPFDVIYSYSPSEDRRSLAPYIGINRYSNTGVPSLLTCPVMQSKWPSRPASWFPTFAPNTYATRYTRPGGQGSHARDRQIEQGAAFPRLSHNVPRPSRMMILGNVIPTWTEGETGFYTFRLDRTTVAANAERFSDRFVFSGGTQPFAFLDGHIEMLTAEQVKGWSKALNDEASNLFWRGGYK